MDVVITAAYGDQDKEVRISKPFGAGDQYFLYIDNYFHGQIILINGAWTIADPGDFTTDDIQIILGLVERNENNS